MNLLLCLLMAFLSPTPAEEKPALPPAVLQKEVVPAFRLDKLLFIKISGQGDIADVRKAVMKAGVDHKIDNIMLYSEDMVPVLMPKTEYEKLKANKEIINVEQVLEEALKNAKETEEKEKEPVDKET